MPLVTKPGKAPFNVANLGWLLRHAGDVTTIRIKQYTAKQREEIGADAHLVAWLADGTIFDSYFQSTNVALEWVKRPSLRHAKIETLYAGTLTEGV